MINSLLCLMQYYENGLSAGIVRTFAGINGISGSANGVGTYASFNYPQSVSVDVSGNVYVSCSGSSSIRRITR